MTEYTSAILLGVVFGVVARIIMLKTDYRQYPTYNHGKVIHLSLGIIAAALGAVAIPALKENNYTAITFLTLAAQQFRDVRNMERQTLSKLDEMELVPRGTAYIEGIAMVFESRNYLVIFTSLVASLGTVVWNEWVGIAFGIVAILLDKWFMSGGIVKDIGIIEQAEIRVEGANVYVDDIYIMNIGLEDSIAKIREHAIGFVITPKNKNSVVTLGNLGQRQAILYDLSTILGVYRDEGEPSLVPMIKRDLDTGRLGVFILPQEKDPVKAKEVIERVPLLENAIRKPTESNANRREE